GIGWFVSAAAVYFRDIGQLMGVISTVLFFMAPILYPKSALPESIQSLLYLNPITFPIEQLRNFLLKNAAPDILGISIYTVVALVFAYLGFLWFERVRKGFADVL
ncbi:MAG TPA: sugar ABC transporter permease, partial [Gammaproteobacteria bacterium]|nr:sugar ABC transporter permease [Gammaproteobacteria bacterium]